MILLVNFGGGPRRREGRDPAAAPREPPVAAEILARGWGYAMVGYADIQPDRANTFTEGVIGTTLAPGQTRPAPDDWGTISAWAWGISRIIDYFETDRSIDREADRRSGSLAAGQDRAVGVRHGRADRGGVLRVAREKWVRRSRAATGAKPSTTWRRTSPGNSAADSNSGWAAGTRCRSMRTC